MMSKGGTKLMKEATGELNMTVITIIAIAAIGAFLVAFLPTIINNIRDAWNQGSCIERDAAGNCVRWDNTRQ
jgi:hypothetical protein